jgi:hypothetical protein
MTSIVSFSTFAVGNDEPDDDQLLRASCQALTANPEMVSSKPCHYYIQGFLAGALVIDTAIVTERSGKRYSFIERAYRTRLGTRADPASTASFPLFCVPDDESEARIIKVVSKQLSSPVDTTKVLSSQIYNALKANYPCG